MPDESVPQSLFDEYRRGHAREHELLEKALIKAEATMSTRLEGMNELRAQITGERGSYATKEMLRPLQQFQDRFVGVLLGLTVLNALVTALIVLLLKK